MSAFGVDDGRISKDDDQRSAIPEYGLAAGTAYTGAGAVTQASRGVKSAQKAGYAANQARQLSPSSPMKHIWSGAANKLGDSAKLYSRSAGRYGLAAGGLGLATMAAHSWRKPDQQSTPFSGGKRFVSADERHDLVSRGKARPGGRFPIANSGDLHNAVRLAGHATQTDLAFIKRRASELGESIPVFGKDKLAKYRLPGDNPEAERARQRKKTGLGTAGVGYLMASRAKEVTPGAVDLLSRAPKSPEEEVKLAHEAKLAARAKTLDRLGQKGGAGLVGLGLAMAGEGLASDWRNRGVVPRAKKRTQKRVAEFRAKHGPQPEVPQPVLAKADDTNRNLNIGAGTAGVGALGAAGASVGLRRASAGHLAEHQAHYGDYLRHDTAATIGNRIGAPNAGAERAAAGESAVRAAIAGGKRTRTLRAARVGGRVGVGLGVLSAGLAGGAAIRNRVKKSAFGIGDIDKAYDPERQRHRRQDAYEGAATGGAVVSGAGAAYLGHKARAAKTRSADYAGQTRDAQARLGAMLHQEAGSQAGTGGHQKYKSPGHPHTNAPAPAGTPAIAGGGSATAPAAAPKARRTNWAGESARQKATFAGAAHEHENIIGLGQQAARNAAKAKRFGRGAVGAGLGAVALGASAVGVHRYDRKSGASYGYQ